MRLYGASGCDVQILFQFPKIIVTVPSVLGFHCLAHYDTAVVAIFDTVCSFHQILSVFIPVLLLVLAQNYALSIVLLSIRSCTNAPPMGHSRTVYWMHELAADNKELRSGKFFQAKQQVNTGLQLLLNSTPCVDITSQSMLGSKPWHCPPSLMAWMADPRFFWAFSSPGLLVVPVDGKTQGWVVCCSQCNGCGDVRMCILPGHQWMRAANLVFEGTLLHTSGVVWVLLGACRFCGNWVLPWCHGSGTSSANIKLTSTVTNVPQCSA